MRETFRDKRTCFAPPALSRLLKVRMGAASTPHLSREFRRALANPAKSTLHVRIRPRLPRNGPVAVQPDRSCHAHLTGKAAALQSDPGTRSGLFPVTSRRGSCLPPSAACFAAPPLPRQGLPAQPGNSHLAPGGPLAVGMAGARPAAVKPSPGSSVPHRAVTLRCHRASLRADRNAP